jgi:alpha-galactosidase
MSNTSCESRTSLLGVFRRPVKITMLGAGSMFTPRLVNDILCVSGAGRGQIALVDLDTERLRTMQGVIEKLMAKYGRLGPEAWTVAASSDRRSVLAGSHYVVNCIEVSGLQCVQLDNDIPLKYGVDQCIGDTIGPGGLFKALRTVPVFLEVLADVEELCPEALVLNYTNPMSILCLAAGRTSRVRVVGLCHSVQETSRKLAGDAGVPFDELIWDCAGINHLSWFTRLEHAGRDLYPELSAKVQDHCGSVYESDPVRYDMMLHFGAFITESSGHLSEYVPYYRRRPELVREYCRDRYRGESRFYANNWPTWRQNADAERTAMLRGEKDVGWERGSEYASWIIEACEKDVPYCFHGNVMNGHGDAGELITNLPGNGVVEVACFAGGNGVHPSRYGRLPAQMAHVCASNMAMYDLAATACVERSKEAAVHALLLDPLTAAMCTPCQIKAMTLELFEAEAAFLPGYR